jgi:hypothetical protein
MLIETSCISQWLPTETQKPRREKLWWRTRKEAGHHFESERETFEGKKEEDCRDSDLMMSFWIVLTITSDRLNRYGVTSHCGPDERFCIDCGAS